jgi:hypothetical protein
MSHQRDMILLKLSLATLFPLVYKTILQHEQERRDNVFILKITVQRSRPCRANAYDVIT